MTENRNRRRFLSEYLLGKALCMLLVAILTVGAFLAPKMISSLYDAKTLMQVQYVDMNLNTYAVDYDSFSEKLERIALAAAYGGEFAALDVEETGETLSDSELTEIVSREIGKLAGAGGFLCEKGWWSDLTRENLTRRKKETFYLKNGDTAREEGTMQELKPIPFWKLEFMMTDEQKEAAAIYLKDVDAKETALLYNEADTLTVLLDAEFHKIYAAALDGAAGSTLAERYGIYFGGLNVTIREQDSNDYDHEIGDEIAYSLLGAWREYWELDNVSAIWRNGDDAGRNLMGAVCFSSDPDGAEGSAETAMNGAEIAESADAEMKNGTVSISAAAAGANETTGKAGDVIVEAGAQESGSSLIENRKESPEVRLEAGCMLESHDASGSPWEGTYRERYGCKVFFEMLQF